MHPSLEILLKILAQITQIIWLDLEITLPQVSLVYMSSFYSSLKTMVVWWCFEVNWLCDLNK